MPHSKLSSQRTAREHAQRIRNARLTSVHPIPFELLPAPSFNPDADLESFLRRNNLTAALAEYVRKNQTRAIPSNPDPIEN